MNFYNALELSRKARRENYRATETRWALHNWYHNHPVKAVAHVNGKLDEANRAEYERQPVSLW